MLIQAGSSETGRDFAARHGEAIFTAQLEKKAAQEFYADLKSRATAEGRASDQVLILPGLSPMIAPTAAAAPKLADPPGPPAHPHLATKRPPARRGRQPPRTADRPSRPQLLHPAM